MRKKSGNLSYASRISMGVLDVWLLLYTPFMAELTHIIE